VGGTSYVVYRDAEGQIFQLHRAAKGKWAFTNLMKDVTPP